MHAALKSNTVSTGLAMFAMFFGAGNVVFPLTLGQLTQDMYIFSSIGLMLSAVMVPFTGLIAMILFKGDYRAFFNRIGKIPGFIISVIIICLIGPFGAIPRCITLSHSTVSMFMPNIDLSFFSIISCILIFLFTFRPTRILDLIGYILTPVLLISLIVIIVKGLILSDGPMPSSYTPVQAFTLGLREGYQTLDLLGAFFFSSVIILGLKTDLHPHTAQDKKQLTMMALKASLVGAFLLSAIYLGFCIVAASYGKELIGESQENLIGAISLHVLGPSAGIITSAAVALACLTTSIALASVFAEFLHKDIVFDRIGYIPCLIITLVISYLFSYHLNFKGIVSFIAPILAVCYPALIALSVFNLLNKIYGFKYIKLPVFSIFFLTIIFEWFS